MSDTLQLRDLMRFIRRFWWIPVGMAAVGAVIGVSAATNVPQVYRSEATVLVGPTDGSITQTSTIRASEDLAAFYADMARRQLVLEPVVEDLGLSMSWSDLRNQVSAVVPRENLRIVTVTVNEKSQQRADDIVNRLVEGLVSLSSRNPSDNAQAFINEQASTLKAMINERKRDIDALEAQARATDDPALKSALKSEANQKQDRLIDWQRTYVELAEAEPSADAGGLQVIDEASAVTDKGRAGREKQAVLGSFVGSAVGVLIIWLLYRRRTAAGASHQATVDEAENQDASTHEAEVAEDLELPIPATPVQDPQAAAVPMNGVVHQVTNGAVQTPTEESAVPREKLPATPEAEGGEHDGVRDRVNGATNGAAHDVAGDRTPAREFASARLGYGRVRPAASSTTGVALRETPPVSRGGHGRVNPTIKRLAGSRTAGDGDLQIRDTRGE